MSLKLILILILHLTVLTYSSADLLEPIIFESDNELISNRIINGFTPNRFENPHVVLLSVHIGPRRGTCTGTLISAVWVVTAGHCGVDADSIEVHLGVFSRTEPTPQIIIVSKSQIFVHPDFVSNDTVTLNDIALLQLIPRANTALRGIKSIPFVCTLASNFAGRIGQACGWGITSDAANASIADVLQCVNLPIITNTECFQTWRNEVNSKNICTRTVQFRTTCFGDSGGPLVVRDGLLLRPKLVGATSFGTDPCAGTSPNVFTRISSFSSWITSVTKIFCDFL